MSAEPPNHQRTDDHLRGLWQTQKVEEKKMPLEEIRAKAQSFEKKIRRRNLLEYAAAVIVFVGFGIQIFAPTPPNFMTRVGSAFIVLATIYVVTILHQHGSKNVPDALARASFIEFHRASLESQRDLLNNVWRWYLLPFVPGLVVMFVSFGMRDGLWLTPERSADPVRDGFFLLLFAVVLVVFFFLVGGLNKWHARKLQAEIDALEEQ